MAKDLKCPQKYLTFGGILNQTTGYIKNQNNKPNKGARSRGIKIAGTILAVRTFVTPIALRPTSTMMSEPVTDI